MFCKIIRAFRYVLYFFAAVQVMITSYVEFFSDSGVCFGAAFEACASVF